MRCSEIVEELKKLKRDINFYSQRASDSGKVAKKIYGDGKSELFFEGLEEKFGHLLARENWGYIDKLIEELKDPDIRFLTELPFSEDFLKTL